jgi:hypothetical protein
MPEEKWTDIEGYEGLYQYSSLFRFKSFIRKERILNPYCSKNSYPQLSLYKNGEIKKILVHVFFATIFIPNPENKPQVNHKNGNKRDYRLENLEWVTVSENHLHAYKTGLKKPHFGKDNHAYGRVGKLHPMYGKTGAQCWLYGKTGGSHPRARLVLDTQTGIFYDSAKEAAEAKNINPFYLRGQLSGNVKNLTSFIYA